MNSNFLTRYRYILIILLVFSFHQTFAQSDIHIFGMGGLNYIPMKNFSHWLNQFSNDKIDDVGFNGIFGIKYIANDNHVILANVEIENKNASFYSGFGGATWNFKIIPVAIGYQHLFTNDNNIIQAYAGLNISYNFIEIEGEYSLDTPPDYTEIIKKNRFGFEPNFGFIFKIAESFHLLSEINYRYMSDLEFQSKDVNLSGLHLNLGIQIQVL